MRVIVDGSGERGLVSVVVPLYEGHPLVLETLRALAAQTHTRWEAILVDDGSPTPQEPLVRAAFDDPRVRYLRQENAGPGEARLRGLAATRGEYLQLLDQDDLLSPDKLARQVAFLEARPDVDLTYTDTVLFATGPDGQRRDIPRRPYFRAPPSGDVLAALARHNFISNEAVLARRRAFAARAFHDLPGNRTTNDWHLWLQVLLPGLRLVHASNGLALKRVHGACTSLQWEQAVEGRRRVFEWLSGEVDAHRAALAPAAVAAMEVEWAKDAALLGHHAEARAVLMRALRRAPLASLQHPQRLALVPLLRIPGVRALLLELRARRDPYLATAGAR